MKIFWSIFALLVIGLGVTFAKPSDRTGVQTPPSTMPSSPLSPAGPAGPSPSAETEADDADASPVAAAADLPSDAEPPVQVDSPSAPTGSGSDLASESTVAAGETLAEADVSFSELLGALSGETLSFADADTAAASIETDATETADETLENAEATGSAEPSPASADEGDRFTLAGSGTKADPYRITWDYLTSARETYLPREGRTEIPPHISRLEGSYVSIGGYLQFPLATPEPKELLVMLNQWDGCCIGIPPTPYDAIEVSLTTPANQAERFAVEGSIVGKLKVDPYLVGDWLIGLYLIGDATLDVSGSRSAEEVYGNSPTVGDPNAMPGMR